MRFFQCPWDTCDKEFVRKADLSRHFQIHVDERPFACPVEGCSRRFHQRSSLNIHQRIHTGEKPYICDIDDCQRAFSDPSSYARHQRSHRNDKPYVCCFGSCSQRFSRKAALNRHQLQHEQEDRISDPQQNQSVAIKPPRHGHIVSNDPCLPPSAPSALRARDGDDPLALDVLDGDTIDMILQQITQAPNPSVAALPSPPDARQIDYRYQYHHELLGRPPPASLHYHPVPQPSIPPQWQFQPSIPPNAHRNQYMLDDYLGLE
ncbi:hypothetical protein BJX61DRAFT_48437 [Aspergillus egyptiacus]|nr:hypothetical protein BJX61DRAFT_48437 [Aspergillus egyptiacus]